MKKQIFIIISALCIAVLSATVVFAQSDLPRLIDDADLLTPSEEAALLSKLDAVSQKHQLDVVIVTADGLGGKSAMAYADDFFDYNGYGFGTEGDGVLLLVSMETREWHVSTKGYGITAFTDFGLDSMADEFLPYLSNGDYAEAFNVFADLCDDYVALAKAGTPYDYHSVPKAPFSVGGSLLISAIIGFVIAIVSTEAMKGQLKSVKRQSHAQDYVKSNSLDITESRDFYLYRRVNRTVKPQNTSSGGSSVHRSSSGSFHGGRGGRF